SRVFHRSGAAPFAWGLRSAGQRGGAQPIRNVFRGDAVSGLADRSPAPYRDGAEHLADWRQWLDQALELFLRTHPLSDSLGPVTPSRHVLGSWLSGSHADGPPADELRRPLDMLQREMLARQEASREKGVVLPLASLVEAFDLSPFEELTVV